MNILKLVNIHFKINSNTLSESTYRKILNLKYNVNKTLTNHSWVENSSLNVEVLD